jgi:hypothetical protein
MADVGRLSELLREESRVARAAGEQASAEKLRTLGDDVGEMDVEQLEWVAHANEDELKGFVKAVRLLGGG